MRTWRREVFVRAGQLTLASGGLDLALEYFGARASD